MPEGQNKAEVEQQFSFIKSTMLEVVSSNTVRDCVTPTEAVPVRYLNCGMLLLSWNSSFGTNILINPPLPSLLVRVMLKSIVVSFSTEAYPRTGLLDINVAGDISGSIVKGS